MFVRPALWQMDTVLVDQAVEKFNLKKNNTRKMHVWCDCFSRNSWKCSMWLYFTQLCKYVWYKLLWMGQMRDPLFSDCCGCIGTWVRSPPASPRRPLRASASQTAALPAAAGKTTKGEPPSAQHWDCCSLQGRADGHKDNVAEQTEGCDLQAAYARYTHLSHSNLWGFFVLTCQLHIVAQLSGDWQLRVEPGCPL